MRFCQAALLVRRVNDPRRRCACIPPPEPARAVNGVVQYCTPKRGAPRTCRRDGVHSGDTVAAFVTLYCTFAVNRAAAPAFLRVSERAHRKRGFVRRRVLRRQKVHMKTFSANLFSRLCALLAAIALALAQGSAQAQSASAFSQQELDQMLAPVALYPDALLSQILMAATYPLEVLEAARWARDHPDLSGDDAVRAAEGEDWDPSVKSLIAFPQVLARMAENLQWTQALGDAFLEQQPQVIDTVQALRRRAQSAGNLRPDDRMRVIESGPGLMLEPYNPEVVYVPYYDPLVVYGSWWWPAYPPVYLRPWAGYYARPAYAGGLYWGTPVAVSPGFFFGAIDWRQRQARVVRVNPYYFNNPGTPRQANVSPQPGVTRPGAWHHDPYHRGGLSYRSSDAQRRFGAASAAAIQGSQARAADVRPDPRLDMRRPDARTGVQTRPAPATVAAPAAPAAPIEIRIEGPRPDARPQTRTATPPANLAPPVNTNRIDIRQEPRAIGTNPPARGGSVTKAEVQRDPAHGFTHSGEDRMRTESHVHPQLSQPRPGAHIDPAPVPQPHVEILHAPAAARPGPATIAAPRTEPAQHHQAPQASPAQSEPPAAGAAPRQPEGKTIARPKTGP